MPPARRTPLRLLLIACTTLAALFVVAPGSHAATSQADTALPRNVDTESDAGLLHQFDLNVAEVEAAEADADSD